MLPEANDPERSHTYTHRLARACWKARLEVMSSDPTVGHCFVCKVSVGINFIYRHSYYFTRIVKPTDKKNALGKKYVKK